MSEMVCGECGIAFSVPDKWLQARRDDGKSFWCPNGHERVFGETTVMKLERDKKAVELKLQAQINETQHALLVAQKERDSERRKRRKIESRISKGVCPCCNRTFSNIQQHMATKHKEYGLPPGSTKQITEAVQ